MYDPEALGVRAVPAKDLPPEVADELPPIAEDMPPVRPEVPMPKPGPGSGRIFMDAAKAGFKAGIKSLWSADTIVGVAATLLLAYADKAATADAIRRIQIKFIKEGFAKGVAAGVLGWTEEEVALNAMNRVTDFRVHGLGDAAGNLRLDHMLKIAEAYENYAVGVGYYFARSRAMSWQEDMRVLGFNRLKRLGYTNLLRTTDDMFEYRFLATYAWAWRDATDAIVGPAIRTWNKSPRELEKRFPTGGRNAP